MNKKLGILLLSIITTMLVVGFAYAAEPSGATVSGETDLGEFNAQAAGAVSVEAGNVTQADLDTNQSTFRWVGLLGNVSGNIILGDNNNVSLYTWVAEGNLVYASVGTVNWANLATATSGDVTANNAYLATGSDNYDATFIGASEDIGSNIFTINANFSSTASNGGTDWKTYALDDGSANSVFAGKVNAGNQDYAGAAADYQMIIPEDGTAGNTLATSYNLWVELV